METYLKQLNIRKSFTNTLRRTLLILSLVVVTGVFWGLKLTGITMAGEAFCGMEEHVHGDTCTQPALICQMEEAEPHVHDDGCRELIFVCTIPDETEPVETEPTVEEKTAAEESADQESAGEEAEEEEETVPEPTEPSPPPHVHDESCWQLAEDSFICGLEETEGHHHTEDCYEIPAECGLQEHIHVESCYSDMTADVETADDWKAMMQELDLGQDPMENLLTIAGSQLEYQESILNFQVDEYGVRRGISRYGQWYGNPYGDWSAMFVGFCLDYAGFVELPISGGPENLRTKWDEEGLYGPVPNFSPSVGSLMFLDQDMNGSADAVAIITGLDDDEITAVAGDWEDRVAEVKFAPDDPQIMGYGLTPVEPVVEFEPAEGDVCIGQTVEDPQILFEEECDVVIYICDGADTYALDGYGAYAPANISEDGMIYVEEESPERFFWSVTQTENGYEMINTMTRMNIPADALQPVMLMAADDEGGGQTGGGNQIARAVNYSVWLDGTLGNMMSYRDSDNTRYTVTGGSSFKLPTEWKSPGKYAYVLQGWYDVINNRYYAPGESVVVDRNLVFYADWVAASYDIGRYNSSVFNTLRLDSFITTHVFDYGILFNVLSSNASVTFNNNSHSETWSLLTSGNNSYNGQRTLNYIFRDWDTQNCISYPQNTNNQNTFTGEGIYSGLYSENLRSLLFDTDNAFDPATKTGVIGKTYLGTGDYLFQLVTDPNDEHYGYYFYDSDQHAASYNQTDQRFYVYNYLERTTSSAGEKKYSDFMPLNSPYANTNGKRVPTYTYRGVDGEYVGTNHYCYDSVYSEDAPSDREIVNYSQAGNVTSNFWFGMMTDVKFYLPSVPGERDSSGQYGNQDVYGKDMHFQFSGDDDVWVLVDGKLVLDIGGIHGIESGDINFATGAVTVYGTAGTKTSTLSGIAAGDHTLTICYLERGASQSNCKIYFNLAPRFSFNIQKEDVLTKAVLNGAEFSVYEDEACTVPARLWTSKASHDRGDPSTNVFTVTDGVASMWGMGAGHSYYIKETKPPDQEDYTYPYGIIRLTIDKKGTASYSVVLLDEAAHQVSPGFTVHGFRIDEESQQAYIVATNAPKWVTETTSILAMKKWNDTINHSGQTITVYLTITDPDGTVRRLQEAKLGSDNNWQYTWENLPKYYKDGVTPIEYGVEEAYISGYSYTVERITETTTTTTEWKKTTSLQNGKTYIFGYNGQYLSTQSTGEDVGFKWVSESEAKSSNLAKWTVKTNGNKVMLTNGANQTISFYYGNGSYITDFFAATDQTESNDVKRYFTYSKSGETIRLYFDANTDYYLSPNLNSSQKFDYVTNANQAMALIPWTLTETTTTVPIDGLAYQITNTPLDKETSLTVNKSWNYGFSGVSTGHEKLQVTLELMANGKGTGRTVTLNLQNGWTDTFRGLPYQDSKGNVITYTVQERGGSFDWIAYYGEVTTHPGNPPTYSTTVTNVYRWGTGAQLPSTGTAARYICVLLGSGIMLASLVYGIGTRRRRERGTHEDS